jgi:hypothetical protein
VTRSSAGTGTSCRCAQTTSRHHSRSYEQTYSHQFEHRQMIDLMQNVGEFEGTAIANELAHTCAPARASPMDCSHKRGKSGQNCPNRYKVVLPMVLSEYFLRKNSGLYSIATVFQTVGQLCACLRPQKSDLTPSPPRPRIRGASPKYFPLFRQKEFSYER